MVACSKKCGVAAGVMIGIGAVIIVIIAVVVNCFNRLETSQVAITYDSYYKELGDQVYYEGLHIHRPTLDFITFSSVFQTISYNGKTCMNKDMVKVTLSISMQYKIRPSYIKEIVTQFRNVGGYESMLQRLGTSAINDVCVLFDTVQLQTERGRFQELLAKELVTKFNLMYTDIQDLQVNNINRPSRYEQAIKNKESAREDIQVAKSERPRLLTTAETSKREAASEAEIITDKAKSEAKIIINKASNEAEGILNDYKKEAQSYKQLKQDNGLDNEGFLAYMGVRAIANAKNPVHVGMDGPAKTSYASP